MSDRQAGRAHRPQRTRRPEGGSHGERQAPLVMTELRRGRITTGPPAPQPQLTGCRPPTVVLASTGGERGGSAPERHVTPGHPLARPDAAFNRQGGEGGGGGRTRSHSRKERRIGRRPRRLTGEGPDALSSDLSSSNVRSKAVTAFSFDDIQSFIVL